MSRYLSSSMISLMALMLTNCVAPVNTSFESARSLGKGNMELLGAYSHYAASADGESESINDNISVRVGYGVSDRFDLKFRGEYLLAKGDETNVTYLELAPKFSLLAVRVRNGSADTVFFPESVLMFAGRDTLQPLTMEAAGEALRQTTAEDGGQGVVEVEIDAPLANLAVDIFNIVTQEKANLRFVKELQEFYLVPSYVAPGQTVAGLLALLVKPETPLRFVRK